MGPKPPKKGTPALRKGTPIFKKQSSGSKKGGRDSPNNNNGSPSSLRTIIHQVTAEKLQKLQAQKDTLSAHFDPVLKATAEGSDALQKLRNLQKAIKESPIKDSDNDNLDSQLKDLDVLIELAETERSSSATSGTCDQIIQHWTQKLTQEIKFILQRCDYSFLYGSIMTDYLDGTGTETKPEEPLADPKITKEATVKELTDRIFVTPDFDKRKFKIFLTNKVFQFNDYEDNKFMTLCIDSTTRFGELLSQKTITTDDLQDCIKGLYSVDLLSEEKKSTLKELETNKVALKELATLLTDHLLNFATWNWPAPVPIDFRRNMAGKYRAFMAEDIVTALFLQYVGVSWAVHFKSTFMRIYSNARIWKRPYLQPSKSTQANSIEFCRRKIHEDSFLAVLPDSMKGQGLASYDYDAENQNGCRGTDDDWGEASYKSKTSPMTVKQKLLHIISNEIHLNKVTRPNSPITVVQTDMEWFGPSLIHEAILALMDVLGVSSDWLKFFERFLKAPLLVQNDSSPQTRSNGVSISHMLSTLFGESLLFVMDFYVNNSSGILLHRIHDDFWFWDHRREQTVRAWLAIEEYAGIAGLKLNMDKSGSVTIPSKGGSVEPKRALFGRLPLPQKEIKWGFLQLCSDGVFRITLETVQPHIEEMGRILTRAPNVVEWVNIYNKYMKFFIRNFGECALTLGTQHIEQMISAVQLITSEVFKAQQGSLVKALQDKFPNLARPDLLDAWIYWPVALGGLGVKNYLLKLISLRKTYKTCGKDTRFTLLPDKDKSLWKTLVARSEASRSSSKYIKKSSLNSGQGETVTDSEFSDEEDAVRTGEIKRRKKRQINFESACLKFREFRWGHWATEYNALLESPEELAPAYCSRSYGSEQKEKWLHVLYGPRLVEYFGTEDFINKKLIPVSLISIMQASRVNY